MLGIQYTPGSCREGMANTLHGRMRVMVSRKHLSYTTVTKLQAVEVEERLFKEAVARQFQLDQKKFVDVMGFYYTCFLVCHVCYDFIQWTSKRKVVITCQVSNKRWVCKPLT